VLSGIRKFFERKEPADTDDATANYKSANLLRDRGDLEAALAGYDQAIALKPDYANALCNRGVVLQRLNRLEAALGSFDRAIAFNPGDYLAHYNRAAVLLTLKRPQEALAGYDRAIEIKPDYVEAYCNRGNVLAELGRQETAQASYDRSIEINPGFAAAYFSRGTLLGKRKQREEALKDLSRAIALKPDFAEAHCMVGNLLVELKRNEEALASYEQAIRCRGDYDEAFANLGNALQELNRHEEAIASYDRAIALSSDLAEAFQGRGTSQHRLWHFEAAIASYTQALALNPELKYLQGLKRLVQMQVCDWSGSAEGLERLAERVQAGMPVTPPFAMLAMLDSPALHRQAAEIWVREECPADDALGAPPARLHGEKIRIGYFSSDFRNHPVALLTAELFETHDRAAFDITAFAFGPEAHDAVRKRLEHGFDRFIDVRDQSDAEVVLLSRGLGIDIAVDLGGFTEYSRPRIFAMRAAPVQMSYLGYLGTLGANYMDYLLADSTIVPAEFREQYADKIIYLPSYQENDSKRRASQRRFTREELGLPAQSFVFACFNANYKIAPTTFAVWMRILRRAEDSVLFLNADNPVARRNLLQHAQAAGIDARRLIFGERIAVEDYLARFRVMDLFLDTLPYNAGTTASDALWAGLPVLTCLGTAFAGRVAASLLRALDLPELIKGTMVEYEDMAVSLATDPALLEGVRQRLARNRASAPLFDTLRFTRSLESAFVQAHERNRAGLPPEHMSIEPSS